MKLLVALWALAGTASGLLPVIVPLNEDANGTQWGPVTADMSWAREDNIVCPVGALPFFRH
jgi:hypothetical protein